MNAETEFDLLYGSKYLSVPDLHGQQPRRKIGKISVEPLMQKDGSTKRKFVLYFEGEDKGLPLNKTNATKLAQVLGKDTTKWIGVCVELYAEMTGLGKEGVRLRPLRLATSLDKPDPEMNDAIPF
jgi:hypothetical protein